LAIASLFKPDELFRLQDVVRAVKAGADQTAEEAATKAREAKEGELLAELRTRYGGRTLFCYDESHENRFAHKPIREWNAVSLSFEACLEATRKHIFRYHSEDRWNRIKSQLDGYTSRGQYPSLEPEDRLVFQAGDYWYCFFCVSGDEYCDKVAAHLASERKSDAEQKGRGCGCDRYDDL